MAVDTSLLVGSIEQLGVQTCTVQGDACVIPQGSRYLVHNTASLSLLGALVAGALPGTTLQAWLGHDLRVHLHRPAGNWSLLWGTTLLRDLLGFDANLAGQQTYVAPHISPLVWSPGYPATRSVRDEVVGYDIEDEVTEVSADGTVVDTDFHNVQTWDELAWDCVFWSRVRAAATANQGGTWHEFRRRVLVPNHRFQFYERITEDLTDPTDFGGTPIGTYKRRNLPSGKPDRKDARHNRLWNLGLEVIAQPEYS